MTVTNPDIGGLTIVVEDRTIHIAMTGGSSWTFPLGPLTLLDNELERADPPRAAHLTNALGLVHDHFDDIIVAAPSVLSTPSVVVVGAHAEVLAMVELGQHTIPTDYRLTRANADEVFRTLVVEPAAQRRHNPGLPEKHVETIIATLCIVLAIMRRLGLVSIQIAVESAANANTEKAGE